MKSKQKLKYPLLLLFGLLFITNCDKDDNDPQTDLTGIIQFGFVEESLSDYPFSVDQSTYVIENKTLLPYQFDVSNLTATFVAIKGSKVTVNGVEQISGVTKNDFTNDVIYTLTAPDGVSQRTYRVKANVNSTNPDEVRWERLNPNAFDGNLETQEYFYLNGKHWIIAGKAFRWFTNAPETKLYSSTNGTTWTQETPTGSFPVGFHHNIVVREGRAYVVGLLTGVNLFGSPAPTLENDLYITNNGLEWEKVNDVLDSGRVLSPVMNLNNTIYAFGGNRTGFGGSLTGSKPIGAPFFPPAGITTTTLVSSDGSVFTPTANYTAEMPRRVQAASFVFNGKMYIAGGLASTGFPLDDVWSSTDGENWTEVSTGAFSKRFRASTVVYDDKIWMFGGLLEDSTCASDVLVSEDAGVTWNPVEAFQALPPDFTPRCGAKVTVDRNGNILIFGGQTTSVSSTGSIQFTTLTDVWSGKLNKL